MTPKDCPNCDAEVPAHARACPQCGSDETTGWSAAARYDALDLPDRNFAYEEFVTREIGERSIVPRGLHWGWWLLAVTLLFLLLLPTISALF